LQQALREEREAALAASAEQVVVLLEAVGGVEVERNEEDAIAFYERKNPARSAHVMAIFGGSV